MNVLLTMTTLYPNKLVSRHKQI